MSRKIPPCAKCGLPIKRNSSRVSVQFDGLDRRPFIAWHGDCIETAIHLGKTAARDIVATVSARDPRRVSLTQQKAKWGKS